MSNKCPLSHGKDSPCQIRCNIKKFTSTDCCVRVSLILEGQWVPAHPLKSNFEQLNFFYPDPLTWEKTQNFDVFSPFPQVRPFHLSQLQDCSRFQGNPQESQCCSCLSHADVSSCGQSSALRLLLRFSRSFWHKLAIGLCKTQAHFLFFLFEMVHVNSIDVSKLWDTGAARISCYKAYAKLIQ